MKNEINYYYNLYPETIFQTKNEHYFYINNIRYSLIKYKEDINDINKIYNMHLNMLNQKIYIHEILLNIMKKPITLINKEPYVLLKTLYYKDKININNILSFNYIIETKEKKDWAIIWSNKNDYLEFQISELGKKHPLITESFSYYIGLAENAIALTNIINKEEINYVYAHKRIRENETFLEFFNPLNIIIDSKIRDITEYFKTSFFKGENIKNELYYYLNNVILTKSEMILFLARMLYPTYYFDLFEEIITNRKKDEIIIKIIEKNEEYEKILKELYNTIKKYIGNIQIDWLK